MIHQALIGGDLRASVTPITLMLKEFTFRQVADEAAVGGEKVVSGKIFAGYPAEIVEDVIDQLALEGVDGKELEIDGAAIAVGVVNAGDECANFRPDAQLFIEFAREGLFGSFAGLDFAAGEFPFEGHCLLGATLTDENGVSAQDERGGNVTDRLSLFLVNVCVHALPV